MTADKITRQTIMVGIIGEALEKSPLPTRINERIDVLKLDIFCSIFNIRDEDIPFFLNGLKSRNIPGLFIRPSHMDDVFVKLTTKDVIPAQTGYIDSATIRDGVIIGHAFGCEMAAHLTKQSDDIAIIGTQKSALAYALAIAKNRPKTLKLVSSVLEEQLPIAKKLQTDLGFTGCDHLRLASQKPESLAEWVFDPESEKVYFRGEVWSEMFFDAVVEKTLHHWSNA